MSADIVLVFSSMIELIREEEVDREAVFTTIEKSFVLFRRIFHVNPAICLAAFGFLKADSELG